MHPASVHHDDGIRRVNNNPVYIFIGIFSFKTSFPTHEMIRRAMPVYELKRLILFLNLAETEIHLLQEAACPNKSI